jgi:hypothetical protein
MKRKLTLSLSATPWRCMGKWRWRYILSVGTRWRRVVSFMLQAEKKSLVPIW